MDGETFDDLLALAASLATHAFAAKSTRRFLNTEASPAQATLVIDAGPKVEFILIARADNRSHTPHLTIRKTMTMTMIWMSRRFM